jgi:hypothetical protein
MPAFHFIACAIVAAVVWVPARASSQPALKIFDARVLRVATRESFKWRFQVSLRNLPRMRLSNLSTDDAG